MARKRGFDWTADPEDPELRVLVDREPRSVLKDELARVEAAALAICDLPKAHRRSMPLEPAMLAEIETLRRAKGPARKRQLNYVKRLLLEVDEQVLQDALDGETPRAQHLRRADRWRNQLLEGGDDVLNEFLTAHPEGDRQQLRSLIRQKRERQLLEAIQGLMLLRP